MPASRGKPSRSRKDSPRRPNATPSQASPLVSVSTWWQRLSPERKLDVVGLVLAGSGMLLLLGLLAVQRSPLIGGVIRLLSQLFGWGIYILPFTLLIFGLWLVFRRIETLPALTLERVIGSLFFFLWLLVAFHAVFPLDESWLAASYGRGGGWIGSVLQRLLWNLLGGAGAVVALLAWLFIASMLTFDFSVSDLMAFLRPQWARLREVLASQARKLLHQPTDRAREAIQANGFRPITPSLPERVTARPPATIVPQVSSSGGEAPIAWQLPSVAAILDPGVTPSVNEDFIQKRARLIEETLASLGAPAQVVSIRRGPTITQFGVEPLFIETRNGRIRVRVSRIAALADDLALALAAPRIRIQAPVPGHSYVGIEVPNEEMTLVSLRDILESEVFQRNRTPLRFALGRDVAGHPVVADLTAMPHLLIAGTTGSGKSVCVNAILTTLLLHNTPDDLRLLLVDPKRVELTGYNGIPHLLAPVVVEMERVVGALQWIWREMDRRYREFARVGARNIVDYNHRAPALGLKKFPYQVVVIDELADLMMVAPEETERTITRIAQLARATGIHLILATQRPSVDVVTGLIKANFPARIAFAVASGVDSRVILDQPGAERLLGRGDMLYQAPDAASPVRLQGVFVSDQEIQRLVDFWRAQVTGTPYLTTSGPVEASSLEGVPLKQIPLFADLVAETDEDPLLNEAIALVRKEGKASVSMLQRKLRIGYTRASRIIDRLEEKGIVGPAEGTSQVRRVLGTGDSASSATASPDRKDPSPRKDTQTYSSEMPAVSPRAESSSGKSSSASETSS